MVVQQVEVEKWGPQDGFGMEMEMDPQKDKFSNGWKWKPK